MFSFFKKHPPIKIGFEDIKKVISNSTNYILINTLPDNQQDILIKNTITYNQEEEIINTFISDYKVPDKPIIIYGKNCCDTKIEKKYDQITNLGLKQIYLYYGGLFEWLLLNELYGNEEFPIDIVNNIRIDIQKYRPESTLY